MPITFAVARMAPTSADVVALGVFADRPDSRPADLPWAELEARGFEGKVGQVQLTAAGATSGLTAVVGLGEGRGETVPQHRARVVIDDHDRHGRRHRVHRFRIRQQRR